MNSIDKLIKIFSEFPGIGPRQARRFVYFLLTRNNGLTEELSKNILTLKSDVVMCSNCKRFFEKKHDKATTCNICIDPNRDTERLMIVQRDIDLEAAEKNSGWNGLYFVLGGSIPILEKEPEKRVRKEELLSYVKKLISTPSGKATEKLREITLAMNFNPEGENTADYIKNILKDIAKEHNIKITSLGKGLSMGTELEYADPDTLKNALKNRS